VRYQEESPGHKQRGPEMILYKYVPFHSGKKILETNSIGFSQPTYFNDPFDMPGYPVGPYAEPVGEQARTDYIFGMLRIIGKNLSWAENTGILSLTRTPTNPLMWAHYAQKHEGLVIGIDVIKAGLTDEQSNLIPAQFGNVIYVSRRPEQPFISKPGTMLAVGTTHHFPQDHYEKLQRLFLHKPLCWSYEEEVRVVKCINGISPESGTTPSGNFKLIETDGRPLYLLSLTVGCIRELYFGFGSDDEAADALYYQAKAAHPELSVYECRLDSDALSVRYGNYVTLAEAAAG
jgi:hypothetical protein